MPLPRSQGYIGGNDAKIQALKNTALDGTFSDIQEIRDLHTVVSEQIKEAQDVK
jgi:hypothetical protein